MQKTLKYKILIQFNLMGKFMTSTFIYQFMILIIYLSFYSFNYIYLWIYLEITTHLFIFMLMISKKYQKSLMTFFMMNFISSMLIFLTLMFMNNYEEMNMKSYLNFILFLSLNLKMGLFPFNSWMINFIKILEWKNLFIFLTLMKLIPLIIFDQYCFYNNFMLMILMMNFILTPMFSFKEYNLKKIMAYSSILHSSSLLISLWMSFSLMMFYFSIYIYLTFMIMLIFNYMNMFKNQPKYLFFKYKFLISTLMFIYSNMPPFNSFMLKWLFIEHTVIFNMNMFMIFIILLSSMMMTWNYLSSINNFYFMNMINMKKIELFNNQYYMNFYISMSFFMNLLFFMLIYFYYFSESTNLFFYNLMKMLNCKFKYMYMYMHMY